MLFVKERSRSYTGIKIVGLVVFVAIAVLVFAANSGNFFKENMSINEGANIKGEFQQIASMRDITVTENHGKIHFYDDTGQFLRGYGLGFKNPKLVKAGDLIAVADANGKNLKVFDENGVKWSASIDGVIKGVKGNDSGSVSVIYNDSKGKGNVRIYNSEGNVKLSDKFYRGILVDAGADNNNEFFAVTQDVLTNGLVYQVYIYNSNGVQTAMKMVNGEAYIGAGFVEGKLVCCDTRSIFAIDGGKVLWKQEVEDKVKGLYFNKKYFSFSTQASGSLLNRNSTLVVYDSDGEEEFSKDIEGDIKDVQAYDSGIAVCCERDVRFFDYSGKGIWKHNLYKDVKEACFDGIYGHILYGKGVLNIKLKKI